MFERDNRLNGGTMRNGLSAILSSEKRFDADWIGSPALNALGLHGARMRLARGCEAVRRMRAGGGEDAHAAALARDGYVVIPDLLPPAAFAALRQEATDAADAVRAGEGYPAAATRGFGPRLPRSWGFDRFDGGTLNRFVTVGPRHPLAARLAASAEIDRLSRRLLGKRYPGKLWIYETVQGDERANPDPQKRLHRDTFYDAMKFWYFLEPVAADEGPFVYVPGSHRLTRRRRAWEAARARAAARTRSDADDVDGSFRVSEDELSSLGLPAPLALPVPANTLIVANVFGFHRRGDATPGARRLALYGNHRPHPFRLAVG